MARIAGIDLPKDKRIEIGLTYIYGIGRTSAKKILEATGINPDTRVRDLSEADEAALRDCIHNDYIVEGDLRRNVAMDIKRLIVRACPSAARAPRTMRVPVRVPARPWPIRRSKGGIFNGEQEKSRAQAQRP